MAEEDNSEQKKKGKIFGDPEADCE